MLTRAISRPRVFTRLRNGSVRETLPLRLGADGEIWVSLECASGHVEIRVRDAGIGISSDLLPRVFEMFEQGRRDLARSTGGLGIGLSIVKKLTELHGGSVVAESAGIDKGSEFTVRLPARAEEGATLPVTSHKD